MDTHFPPKPKLREKQSWNYNNQDNQELIFFLNGTKAEQQAIASKNGTKNM